MKKYGFTLAEILLSLSIIGIVAAIALPSLLGNVSERAFETQKKALYTRFSQGLALLPSLNGYGTLTGTLSEGRSGEEGYVEPNVITDTAAESFVRDGLSKVMKVTNICTDTNLTDCGLPDKIIPLNGGSAITLSSITTLADYNSLFNGKQRADHPSLGRDEYEQLNTKAAAFETVNGESILVYYNPYCSTDLKETDIHFTQPKLCANFIYDLNGKKGPNTVGKDIGFMTALYALDPVVVAPRLYPADETDSVTFANALSACSKYGEEGKLPNLDEATAMLYNKRLWNPGQLEYWSSTSYNGTTEGWRVSLDHGRRYHTSNDQVYVRCIKR